LEESEGDQVKKKTRYSAQVHLEPAVQLVMAKLEKRHRQLFEAVIAYLALSKYEWTTPWKEELTVAVEVLRSGAKRPVKKLEQKT
jgi:hypothetical protein